jgi:streptogramin lyase
MKSKIFLLIASLTLTLLAIPASAAPSVYVVTLSQQFGTVDLDTGAFHPIGDPTPEGQTNLVWGTGGSLLSLTVSGNLVKINPATGDVTVIDATGLGFNAFDLAEVRGKLYLTDFSNNIYTVDPETGAATFLRATGMPPDPTIPFTLNNDGTLNLCDESFYGVNGKLYATFDSFAVGPDPAKQNYLGITTNVDSQLYQIDPATGTATLIGPTDLQLGASVEVDGKFYAFRLVFDAFADGFPVVHSQLVRLDRTSGKTTFVRDIDPAAGAIFGAAPVRRRRF